MKWHGWASVLAAAGLAACGGDDTGPGGEDEPLEQYACTQLAVGDILDVSASREDARELKVGRTPYRINLLPGVAGFVAFTGPAGADLTLVANYPEVVVAWWDGDERFEFGAATPDPNCDTDLPVMEQFTTSGGPAWLELGPANQGSVWVMLGE